MACFVAMFSVFSVELFKIEHRRRFAVGRRCRFAPPLPTARAPILYTNL